MPASQRHSMPGCLHDAGISSKLSQDLGPYIWTPHAGYHHTLECSDCSWAARHRSLFDPRSDAGRSATQMRALYENKIRESHSGVSNAEVQELEELIGILRREVQRLQCSVGTPIEPLRPTTVQTSTLTQCCSFLPNMQARNAICVTPPPYIPPTSSCDGVTAANSSPNDDRRRCEFDKRWFDTHHPQHPYTPLPASRRADYETPSSMVNLTAWSHRVRGRPTPYHARQQPMAYRANDKNPQNRRARRPGRGEQRKFPQTPCPVPGASQATPGSR